MFRGNNNILLLNKNRMSQKQQFTPKPHSHQPKELNIVK